MSQIIQIMATAVENGWLVHVIAPGMATPKAYVARQPGDAIEIMAQQLGVDVEVLRPAAPTNREPWP